MLELLVMAMVFVVVSVRWTGVTEVGACVGGFGRETVLGFCCKPLLGRESPGGAQR